MCCGEPESVKEPSGMLLFELYRKQLMLHLTFGQIFLNSIPCVSYTGITVSLQSLHPTLGGLLTLSSSSVSEEKIENKFRINTRNVWYLQMVTMHALRLLVSVPEIIQQRVFTSRSGEQFGKISYVPFQNTKGNSRASLWITEENYGYYMGT